MLEKSLAHEPPEEVRKFYAGLPGPARVGVEASGKSPWFERLLAELKHELWMGDSGKIRAQENRKQRPTGRAVAARLYGYRMDC